MEPTTIILIVIFAICGLVLVWAIKNGNNIKFEKKEKKSKESKKEKFKEILPKEKKEKPEKEEKKEKETIRESVKKEKSGNAEPPSNKVMKVTKEDFQTNNMDVPKNLGGEERGVAKPKEKDIQFNANDLSFPPMPPIHGFDGKDFNFDDKFLQEDFSGLGLKEEDFLKPMLSEDKLLDNPFLPMPEDDKFSFGKDINLDDDILMGLKNDMPQKMSHPVSTKGEIKPESIEARLERVFGDTISNESGVKEVLVGEILSGNRSKVNRDLREKRKKWMK